MEQRVQAASTDMDPAGILQLEFGLPLFFVQSNQYSEKKIPLLATHIYNIK
jgi:hypothetical protein